MLLHYLSLDGENVVANRDGQAVARYPLHTLSGILSFSYAGASPALMGACAYFRALDHMILNGKEVFSFQGRTRRPPLDPFNALLSFAYSLLANDCASALESVGLDSYVGFLHRDRPGRTSLALDLMEELRPCLADRFVLTLINNRVVSASDFQYREGGAVLLTDEARRTFLKA